MNHIPAIPAIKIEITRAEGPTHLCDKLQVFEGLDCWTKAATWLASQSSTFPKERGYDKHDFCVTFEDGETYEGRLDCKHDSCVDNDLDVARHVRSFCEFQAGIYRPAWMDDSDWSRHMQRIETDGTLKSFRDFLSGYAIP